MTVGYCPIHLDGWGAPQTPQQFHGRVRVEVQGVQGASPLEAPQNLHLTVPKSGSNIAQQCMDSYAFFHVHCSTKSKENQKGTKFSILTFMFLTRNKKCVRSMVLAG